jgi:hypothetical protein
LHNPPPLDEAANANSRGDWFSTEEAEFIGSGAAFSSSPADPERGYSGTMARTVQLCFFFSTTLLVKGVAFFPVVTVVA